ncbi:MAG: hypothetical protein AB1297_08525, partial [bacterium]
MKKAISFPLCLCASVPLCLCATIQVIIFLLLIPSIAFCPQANTLYLSTTSDPKTFNLIISNETSTSEALAF